jgi:hypothetical protein
MSDDVPYPIRSPRGERAALERQRRQAEALRANLARRKQQNRARVEDEEQDDPPQPEAGLAPDQGKR